MGQIKRREIRLLNSDSSSNEEKLVTVKNVMNG